MMGIVLSVRMRIHSTLVMLKQRHVSFSQGKAIVTNARQQHLHCCSYVPKDPLAVVVFLPGLDESCLRYEGLFKYLAAQQIAVFALEQSPLASTAATGASESTAMYKHPNPEVNFQKQASNMSLFPAPNACGVTQYVDDVHQFALGVAQRMGDHQVDYFLCGVYYGGVMAAHTGILSEFPWKGIIVTAPDLIPPVGIMASITTTISSQWRSFLPTTRPTFASFRDRLLPRSKDHMGNDFTDTTERTFTEEENKSEVSDPTDEAFKELDFTKHSLHVPLLLLNGKLDSRKPTVDIHNFFLGLTCAKKDLLDFKELYHSMGQEQGNADVNQAILTWIHSFQANWI
ncbi:hypothetical protein DYB37_009106 [Aphanomyces astaci]|uniref:Serine aminopeptidase S33 domain-containing protein n=3 Tax=Aphanomyces astaci TaxID=112090 RepID=A0A3R6X144_APHAT|nr:hypothetical protein DYB35_009194 [Aphanomyces astaci]RHZ06164.1 hypothetical protein DYB37_009106 [Aphanomyces astaci]